jgi:hypothetical protein
MRCKKKCSRHQWQEGEICHGGNATYLMMLMSDAESHDDDDAELTGIPFEVEG